jgi:hypothetical protein
MGFEEAMSCLRRPRSSPSLHRGGDGGRPMPKAAGRGCAKFRVAVPTRRDGVCGGSAARDAATARRSTSRTRHGSDGTRWVDRATREVWRERPSLETKRKGKTDDARFLGKCKMPTSRATSANQRRTNTRAAVIRLGVNSPRHVSSASLHYGRDGVFRARARLRAASRSPARGNPRASPSRFAPASAAPLVRFVVG